MKKYSTVEELENELLAEGYSAECNVTIPAHAAEPVTLTDANGNHLHYYEDYKYYHIIRS